MADNIKLITFAGSTVTPQDDALIYEIAVGQSGIISGGAITLKNNNTIHIAAGHGIVCGRKFSIVESDITVLLTTGETLSGRVYVHLDLSNTTDPIQIFTETGSVLSEPIQQEDINIANGIYEFNLATFTIDALTISDLVDVKPRVVINGNVDTLTTMEQVEATTDATTPVGAGAIKELNESLPYYDEITDSVKMLINGVETTIISGVLIKNITSLITITGEYYTTHSIDTLVDGIVLGNGYGNNTDKTFYVSGYSFKPNKIRWYNGSDANQRCTSQTWYYSDDNSSWVEGFNITMDSNEGWKEKLVNYKGEPHEYWKVVCKNSVSSNFIGGTEVEIYGHLN